jgi:purine-binding chemotaxis protein CheW
MAESRLYCTFLLDGLYCALDATFIQEILEQQKIVPVPLAPPVVAGLINLRGQIVTALDLRQRMNMPDRAVGAVPAVIVVQTADGAMSLLVDEVGDVVAVSDALFEPPPDTVPADLRRLIFATCKLKERLLIILDLHTILMPDPDEDDAGEDDRFVDDASALDSQVEFDS